MGSWLLPLAGQTKTKNTEKKKQLCTFVHSIKGISGAAIIDLSTTVAAARSAHAARYGVRTCVSGSGGLLLSPPAV